MTADRGVGASSQQLFYDSNSSCHLLSYGRGVGERLKLTPMTRLDLMRTDGTLSVEGHIKRLCHRSAGEFYAKLSLSFTWKWPSEVWEEPRRCRAGSSLIFQLRDAETVEFSTHRHECMQRYKHSRSLSPPLTHMPLDFSRKKFWVRYMIFQQRQVITAWIQRASTALHVPLVDMNT